MNYYLIYYFNMDRNSESQPVDAYQSPLYSALGRFIVGFTGAAAGGEIGARFIQKLRGTPLLQGGWGRLKEHLPFTLSASVGIATVTAMEEYRQTQTRNALLDDMLHAAIPRPDAVPPDARQGLAAREKPPGSHVEAITAAPTTAGHPGR